MTPYVIALALADELRTKTRSKRKLTIDFQRPDDPIHALSSAHLCRPISIFVGTIRNDADRFRG